MEEHLNGFEGDLPESTLLEAADELFRPGERVRLLSNGYMTRVTH